MCCGCVSVNQTSNNMETCGHDVTSVQIDLQYLKILFSTECPFMMWKLAKILISKYCISVSSLFDMVALLSLQNSVLMICSSLFLKVVPHHCDLKAM